MSCYGGKIWQTPNIDRLASEGTLFRRHYTTAPSTAMAITSMFSGLYPYELDRQDYREVPQFSNQTLFDEFHKRGYRTAVIWPESFMEYAWKYSKVFPQDTKIFNIQYPINSNKNHSLPDTEALKIVEKFQSTLKSFASAGHYLVWIHLPNVFPGREGFGSDIDLFDDFVGKVSEQYLQDDLYITSDHGYLKLEKNTLGYGFHLNEAIVHVPLITPRYRDNKEILFPTSHVQLGELICDSELTKRDSIYIDTKYYQQQ